ncbi:hypothetical protein [Halorhabdus rudnickae]|uniref:hypothetical protein n=1 Tax=Halorhabdus rudnickae TaxID=1775544 RepID=UPI0010844F23|nr:hypothetical protein [Halorhabdus rudnickae]
MSVTTATGGEMESEEENLAVIEGGSTWEFADDAEVPKPAHREFEVTEVRVMEDGSVSVTVSYGTDNDEPDEEVDVEDIREKEREGKITRTNTAHEAWKNRNAE